LIKPPCLIALEKPAKVKNYEIFDNDSAMLQKQNLPQAGFFQSDHLMGETPETHSTTTPATDLSLASQPGRRAEKLFLAGLDCRQAVMAAFGQAPPGQAERPEPAGGPSATVICGSLAGAISVLQAALVQDRPSADPTLELVQGFRGRHGSLLCQTLTGQMSPEDRHVLCGRLVRSVADDLQSLLARLRAPKGA
jgi:hypothetical protein